MMERRLGRGLGSLLGGTSEPAAKSAGQELGVELIRPNPFQPRKEFDAEALEELRASIRAHGVLQPICVRRQGDHFELISGERRLRAARLSGLSTIPAVVRDSVSDAEMLELALVENIQRSDLNPLERAAGYRSLMDTLKLTQEQVADKVGIKRATVANHLRLLELPDRVQQAVRAGLISMGHARAILAFKDTARMDEVVQFIVRDGLSVRQVEDLSRRPPGPIATTPNALEPKPKPKPTLPWVAECEERLREALGTKVRILAQPGYRGQIVLDYFTREDLERLLDQLAPRKQI